RCCAASKSAPSGLPELHRGLSICRSTVGGVVPGHEEVGEILATASAVDSLAGRAALLVELSSTDRRGHVLRLFTIDRAILELDHRIELLPREPLQVGALSWARRSLHDLVVDALLV